MAFRMTLALRSDKPSLYVSRDCDYWWSTVPYLSHDVKRREDLDTHGADVCRYGLLAIRSRAA
jgi:hypothetical protein